NACKSSVALSAAAATVMNGPRPLNSHGDDTTRFFVDRFGAPTRIRNALSQETILERGDARWPAAVTQVMDPRGHILRATYDEKGRPLQTIDVNPDGSIAMAPNSYAAP